MADIGISVGLDTSQLQQGARGAADSLGNIREEITKLNTSAEQRNAIYDYLAKAEESAQQYAGSLDKINELVKQIQQQNGTLPTPTVQQNNPQVAPIQNPQNMPAPNVNPQVAPIQNPDDLTRKLREANISHLKAEIEVCNKKLGEMYLDVAGMNSESKEFANTMQTISKLESQKSQLKRVLAEVEGENKGGGNVATDLLKRFFGGGQLGFLGKLGIGGAIAAGVVKAVDMGLKTYSGKTQTDIAAEGQYLNGDVINANITEKENSLWTKIPLIGGTIKSGIQVFDTNEQRRAVTELNGWIKEATPTMDSLSMYGSLNQGNAIENSRKIADSYARMADLVSRGGTGYSTNEGVEVKNQLAQYGYKSENAEIDANSILKWQRATGAGRSELIDFVGYASRYGGANGATNALGIAYGGLTASGMEKGQLSEFLRGMQSVMEEGISKGFVYGADEVARNMSFFSKLTGNNAMWSGENAARKISGINSSIENSTNLDSVAAVMNFQVAQSLIGKTKEGFDAYMKTFDIGKKDDGLSLYTGTPLDVFMAMEKGLSTKTVGVTMDALSKQFNIGYGKDGTLTGDVLSAATMLSQMWGLNNTGAVQMMKTWAVNGAITNGDIEKITSDPTMTTKETQAQKTIEDIKTDVQKIASTGITTAQSILDEIKAKNGTKIEKNDEKRNPNAMDFDAIMGDLYGEKSVWGSQDKRAYKTLKERFKNAKGNDADIAVKILDYASTLSAEDKNNLDTSGVANSFENMSFDEILQTIQKKEYGVGNAAILSPFSNLDDDFKYSLPGTQKKWYGLSVPYSFDDFLRNEAAPLVNGVATENGTTVDKVIAQIKRDQPYLASVYETQKSDGIINAGEMKTLLQLILSAIKQQTSNGQMLKDAMEAMSININVQQ